MVRSRDNDIKKKMGRPATGQGSPVLVRVQPDQLSEIDEWAAKQNDAPSRPEAIRRLVAQALRKP